MLEERKTGVAVIVFVNLPAAVSTFILAICGCTKEQEGLGGVELADGVFPLHMQKAGLRTHKL